MTKSLYAGTGIRVPSNYESTSPPEMKLRKLETAVERQPVASALDLPLRLTLSVQCNAAAVREFARLFGMYGAREEWNAMCPEHAIVSEAVPALAPAAEAVPALAPAAEVRMIEAGFEEEEGETDV